MRARSSSFLAFTLAVLFAGEAVVGLAHRVQRHVRCAEHGELLHVGAGQGLRELAEPAAIESRADLRTAPAPGEDEHEHCFILALSRERIAPAAAAPAFPPAARVVETGPPRDHAALGGRALYRIAPKNSPPA